jgi:hypothetical protein
VGLMRGELYGISCLAEITAFGLMTLNEEVKGVVWVPWDGQ